MDRLRPFCMQGSQKVDNMAQNIKIEGGNTGKKKKKDKILGKFEQAHSEHLY